MSKNQPAASPSASEAEDDDDNAQEEANLVPKGQEAQEGISAMDKELREMEDDEIRRSNAYPGAENTIGSVHTRRWYLSLDREGVGYKRGKGGKWYLNASNWDEGDSEGKLRLGYPFYVKGVEEERSVVTGRKGDDILRDEGVQGYVSRKGWKPVIN